MQEIELKFLVPKARLKGLMRQAKVKSSQVTPMSAHYFDTPKQDLAKRGIGLRIRREGDEWVQTIKAGGDGIAARLEHNMTLDNERVQAMLETNSLQPDLSIYHESAIAPALADFNLKKLSKKLSRQYVTDVERTTRLLVDEANKDDDKQDKASIIEVAYDHGKIIHGEDELQVQDFQEIEFELVSGDLDFLFATAKVWCKRYKLCLSTVTKAERGSLLIHGDAYRPAVSANLKHLALEQDISMPAFVRAVVHNCLLQILPNSSAIAAGSEDNEHVLQLRIGIQRLRTALKSFKKFSAQLNPEWLPILKQTATLLGDYQQLAYLSSKVEPKLQTFGAPKLDWSADIDKLKVRPIDAVAANDFQLTLLELIAFTMSDATAEPKAKKRADDKLAKRLSKQHIKLLKAEYDFEDFEDSAQQQASDHTDKERSSYDEAHQLRKQLKKMRYISEFAAPLYSKKKSKRWLKRLKKAQQALGDYVDHRQYQQLYQQKSNTDGNALYGAGWFAAQLKADAKRCQKRLDKIQNTASFW